ncbi:hypothetical protein D3C71_1218920 [compost metagenome]
MFEPFLGGGYFHQRYVGCLCAQQGGEAIGVGQRYPTSVQIAHIQHAVAAVAHHDYVGDRQEWLAE